MKHWINKNYRAIIIIAFIIPIITVALVSISHVTKWYGISNPLSWAMYLSIGVEIAALSALAAISARMGRKVYFPFLIVTLIQFIGNIYFSYSFVDINGESFRNWVDLVSPLLQYMGVDSNDYVGHRRFLALFAGGMLPVISLSFLHILVKFTEANRIKEEQEEEHVKEELQENTQKIDSKDLVGEISKVRLSDDDLKKLENLLLKPKDDKMSREEILDNMIQKNQELGLYDPPHDNPLIRNKEVAPALSDEEIHKMNMDEYERKFDFSEDNNMTEEEKENYVNNVTKRQEEINSYQEDDFVDDVNEEYVPTEEEINQNNQNLDESISEDSINDEIKKK